uniref:BTB domain-containing protein n=1 Tax=Anopheles quadriannulatus TaxID=34691 RepID=A0A182XLY2_ANOQN
METMYVKPVCGIIKLQNTERRASFPAALHAARLAELLVDVTICCETRKLRAHKLVLALGSPFFRSIFNEVPTPHPVVMIYNVKYEDLDTLVKFLYTGELSVERERLPSLLEAARYLQLDEFSTLLPYLQETGDLNENLLSAVNAFNSMSLLMDRTNETNGSATIMSTICMLTTNDPPQPSTSASVLPYNGEAGEQQQQQLESPINGEYLGDDATSMISQDSADSFSPTEVMIMPHYIDKALVSMVPRSVENAIVALFAVPIDPLISQQSAAAFAAQNTPNTGTVDERVNDDVYLVLSDLPPAVRSARESSEFIDAPELQYDPRQQDLSRMCEL